MKSPKSLTTIATWSKLNEENSLRNFVALVVLVFSTVGFCFAADNPYGLILQNEFAKRYKSEVEPYWSSNATVSTFASADDRLQLSYAKLLTPKAKGVVVISNGRTETYLKYKELAFDLARTGYSVYIHDHRGQGMSPRLQPDPGEHDKGHVDQFDDYVEDMRAFVLKVVRPEQPPQVKFFLLGHSMGGGIATRYLQKYPDTFAAAALSSPMLEPNAKIFVSAQSSCWWFKNTSWLCPTCYAGFLSKPYQQTAGTKKDYTHSDERWEEVLRVFATNPSAKLGGPTRRWAAEACASSNPMLEQAGDVRTPVLLLQAGDDQAVVPDAQNAFCEKLKAATGKTCNGPGGGPLKIPDAAHELFIEADQYRVPALTAILDFFSKH